MKKSFAAFNSEMDKRGFSKLEKDDILSAYKYILTVDESVLVEIAEDEQQPAVLRVIAADLINEATRASMITEIRNYVFEKNATYKPKTNRPKGGT